MPQVRRLALLLLILTLSLSAGPAFATCGGGGGGGRGGIAPPGGTEPASYVVPWMVMNNGVEAPPGSAAVVYWFPSSPGDARASELVKSRVLTLYSAQCTGTLLVPVERKDVLAKFNVAEKLPALVLVTADGRELARLEKPGDTLRLGEVEKLVRDAIEAEDKRLDARNDEAKALLSGGNREGAIALYSEIARQRCLFGNAGKEASKALKKLGVKLDEKASLDAPRPSFDAAVMAEMTRVMDEGLRLEQKDDYVTAEKLYRRAHQLDSADPVPLRYLGELERHHTGDWKAAREHFQAILEMQADPLSTAVALHGLGKMTIHSGEFEKGLGMFEKSVEVYPLALTLRNLAVYWNSEGKREKAQQYTDRALALDPEDAYNRVFAAVYLAEAGKIEEALKVAVENEGLLPASYNLAAIHALAGNKEKAFELLARHFHEYERYDAVRAKEMWEARVDIVFASIKEDPRFTELTKLADSR